MPLTSGTKLGPYEIVSPLGAGGMGEVYRARDSRLGREVAVKVLPQHLSANPEVRTRFEREAKTVSSLNHPNICTLFDVGREGDTDYLVMELVDGETLAQRLTKGAMPPADVLRVGAQIADALDRAHRAGVIHRDLKPGNVMLTKSGAKLMDFGLARATGLAGVGGGSGATMMAMTQSPTMAAPLTAEGTIVGTFQYMAPEQLEGKEADARSDLWALGCVLYEMATGKRAFDGATQASLISAIMRDQPRPMSLLSPMSSPALERLVNECLAKDPEDRWQSAGDIRRGLEWIASGSTASGMPAVGAPRRGLPIGALGIAAGVLIALAALAVAFGPWRTRASGPPLVRFSIPSPALTLLDSPAEAELSPDGLTLVFVASDSLNIGHLYTRPLGSPDARMVQGTEKATLPFWSPDSRMIGFFAADRMRKVALDGSAPTDLCTAPDGRGGSWSPTGVIVFAPSNQGGLSRVSANGGTPTVVTQPDSARHERGHRYPQFLPDGRHFLYVAIGSDEQMSTFVATDDGKPPVEVCQGGSMARYAAPGYLLFLDSGVNSQRRRLMARRFDVGSMRASGDARLVLDAVNATNFGYPNVTTTREGMLVAQHWSAPRARLMWRDRHGTITGVYSEDTDITSPALSPDGHRLAYAGRDPADLFVRDLSTGVSTRLTFENEQVGNTIWSPDGQRIAFSRLSASRGWESRIKAADGSGPDSLAFHGPALFSFPQSWSRDGRWLVAQCADVSGNFDLWVVPMTGGGSPHAYQHTPALEGSAALSPDGRWLAFLAEDGDRRSLYVQSFPDPGAKYEIAVSNPTGCQWTGNGDRLLVVTGPGEVFEVQVSTTGGFRQGASTRLFQVPPGWFMWDVSQSGERFLSGSPIDVSTSTRLEVVMGWPHLLESH